MEQQYRIYMDACCLNRPFDDWTQPRIRLEAEAILAIAARCQTQQWRLVSSTALESEIAQTPDALRKQSLMAGLALAQTTLVVTEVILNRAKNLSGFGFKSFDALHIACAESAQADIFLSTDDRLLRRSQMHHRLLSISVANPVQWFMTVTQNKGELE
jgi:predicted nucleic acid-binding protein